MHRVLKPTGSFYYHCDTHASHYVKVELDRLFGFDNFRNEIVWKRTHAHGSSRRYGPVHDTILFYAKGDRHTWTGPKLPHDPGYIAKHFRHVEPRTGRRFSPITLTGTGIRRGESGRPWRGIDPTNVGRHWALSGAVLAAHNITGRTVQDRLDALDAAGLIYWPDKEGGTPRLKEYADELSGVALPDIWTDVPPLAAQSKERRGYPTQKPLALLERILEASSEPGQIVLDAFWGCGTTLEAAARHGRRWIGIDYSPTACRVMSDRLEQLGLESGKDFGVWDMPKTEDDLRRMPHFEFENWAVLRLGGTPNRVKTGDFGIDGRLYLADVVKERRAGYDLFGEMDRWYPIQVKQVDKVGRPDIDSFETAMRRDRRVRGYFVAFGFTSDAQREIRRASERDGLEIVPVTVTDLLAYEAHVK